MTVLKPALDENLPPCVTHSLNGWCNQYDLLRIGREDDEDDAALVFALTGHYTVESTQAKARAQLDFSDRTLRHHLKIHQVSDIDSVIGIISEDFPVQDNAVFEYHLMNDVKYTLTSDLHIPGWLDKNTQGTTNELIPYQKIPHAVFGTLDNRRTLIRIFFPKAMEEMEDSVYVGENMLQPFYDLVVKPAAAECVDDHYMRTWPPTYAAEVMRAQKTSGFQFSGKALQGRDLRELARKMREHAARHPELSFCQNWFWMVEIKGVKTLTPHPPPQQKGVIINVARDPRSLALQRILGDSWQFARFKPEDWYLDIATTVSATRHNDTPVSVLIRKDAHPEIVRHFTKEPIDRCIRWAAHDNGRDYQFDEIAQLGQIGGLRLTIRDREPKEVRYFQAYTSEKSLVYQKDGKSVALNSSIWKVLDDWAEEKRRFFSAATQTFGSASDKDTTSHIAARFESRVSFGAYPFVHHEIPRLKLDDWLYYFDTRSFWGFKARRMSAITRVLGGIIDNRAKISWHNIPEVGSLVILLLWMANALANRPSNGGSWDVVRDSGSVHRRNDDGEVVPDRPLVYYALHSLFKGPVHRLSSHRTIDTDIMLRLVSRAGHVASMADFFLMLNPVVQKRQSVEVVDWGDEPTRVSTSQVQPASNNKRRKINLVPISPGRQVFGDGEGQIAIDGLGGDDEEHYPSEDEDPERRQITGLSHAELSSLVNQVAVQVFAKAPNHKGTGRSYCLLDSAAKLKVTNTIFETRDTLSTTWRAYTLFTDYEKWENTVNRLFPTRAEYAQMTSDSRGNPTKPQGLYSLGFWTTWQCILNRASPNTEAKIVQAMRQNIHNTWRWFPAIEGGKLWNTAKKPKQQHFGDLDNGPWIACNPRFSH